MFDDEDRDDAIDSLPEPIRLRIEAVSLAVQYKSLVQPRETAEQALDEILELADLILDDLYGGRDERLRRMPYREYLTTPEWRARRRVAYDAAGFRCQLCNASDVELNAHHRDYAQRGTPAELSDLIVLCRRCHTRIHEFIWKVDHE